MKPITTAERRDIDEIINNSVATALNLSRREVNKIRIYLAKAIIVARGATS